MNIQITGRHVKITPEFEQYARSKAEKVQKFVKKDARIEIVLDHAHDNFQIEMIVSANRGPVVIGHVQHAQALAAIDLVVDKVDHQLRRLRDRKKHHHGPSMSDEATHGKSPSGDAGLFGDGEGTVDDIVHKDEE